MRLFIKWVKKIRVYDSDGSLSWWSRIIILGICAGIVTGTSVWWVDEITKWLLGENIKDTYFVFPTLFIFGFVFSLGAWIVRTHDRKKEFKDSLQTQHETLFQNAVEMVLSDKPLAKRVLALRQLARLRHQGVIEEKAIDQITDSGLKLGIGDNNGTSITETVNLARADLSDMLLSGADLQGANLQYANLAGANLQGANLADANLQYANLAGANLQGANLAGANLQSANLHGTNLQDANLQDANLQYANLQGAELKDSGYDSKTIFPEGFDPAQHGMEKQQIPDLPAPVSAF